MDKLIVGCLEVCDLAELGILQLEVRVDTGAKTSSLHVDNLKHSTTKGKPWIQFDIHPDIYHVEDVVQCKAPVHDIRQIKSSNGEIQQRYVIKTPIKLGGQIWPIEITLTDRSDMKYLMLLGREGMGSRILVDPSESFLIGSE